MSAQRRRVLIVQSTLRPPGGSQAVAAWTIEALKGVNHLALACWEPPDLGAVNRAYGTTIQDDELDVHAAPRWLRLVVGAIPLSMALLRWAMVLRIARRLAGGFDVTIIAENEADIGRPVIQYVHYPRQLRPRPAADLRWYHRPRVLLAAYYALCDRLTGFSIEGVRRNRTLANSSWTARRLRELDGDVAIAILPPPVAPGSDGLPWDDRANGFVCIGRFAAEKEIEKVIAIVAAVRDQAPDVHLHLIGGRGPERSYYRRVKRLAQQYAEWVHVHEGLSRRELASLIGEHRYGIHGMREEHFGMAAAEMVEGGCLVFVPDDGGQVDIVGGNEWLTYKDFDDAVRKIASVLLDRERQGPLRADLSRRKGAFSSERFMHVIRDEVATFPTAT